MFRNSYGAHVPIRLQMEKAIVSQVKINYYFLLYIYIYICIFIMITQFIRKFYLQLCKIKYNKKKIFFFFFFFFFFFYIYFNHYSLNINI